jgi:hypothetical protein
MFPMTMLIGLLGISAAIYLAGRAIGRSISLLAGVTAEYAEAGLAWLEQEYTEPCPCSDSESCDICLPPLPADDEDFELSPSDADTFIEIIRDVEEPQA